MQITLEPLTPMEGEVSIDENNNITIEPYFYQGERSKTLLTVVMTNAKGYESRWRVRVSEVNGKLNLEDLSKKPKPRKRIKPRFDMLAPVKSGKDGTPTAPSNPQPDQGLSAALAAGAGPR
jgi:hypothetical protein